VSPPNEDGVLEVDTTEEDEGMPVDQATQAHEQNMAALMQTGVVAQNHFVGFTKLADYDYLEGHRVIGITEAMGIREVSSKKTPAGPDNANA